jgi:hypothetical protein
MRRNILNNLLFHQQNLQMFRHFLKISSSQCTHQLCFPNPIPAHEPILMAIIQLDPGVLEQVLAGHNQLAVINQKLSASIGVLVMQHLRRRQFVLRFVQIGNVLFVGLFLLCRSVDWSAKKLFYARGLEQVFVTQLRE